MPPLWRLSMRGLTVSPISFSLSPCIPIPPMLHQFSNVTTFRGCSNCGCAMTGSEQQSAAPCWCCFTCWQSSGGQAGSWLKHAWTHNSQGLDHKTHEFVHLLEELLFQLVGPLLVSFQVGCQVSNVGTLQQHLHNTHNGLMLCCLVILFYGSSNQLWGLPIRPNSQPNTLNVQMQVVLIWPCVAERHWSLNPCRQSALHVMADVVCNTSCRSAARMCPCFQSEHIHQMHTCHQ